MSVLHRRFLLPSLACLGVILAVVLGAASAASAAPVWTIDAVANPSAAPGTQADYIVVVRNLGDTSAPATVGGDANNCAGAPPPADRSKCWTVTASFPAGVTPVALSSSVPNCAIDGGTNSVVCPVAGDTAADQVQARGLSDTKVLTVTVEIDPAASGTRTSSFTVSGAGAGTATTSDGLLVTDQPPAFGVADFDGEVAADAAGTALTQAGGHPYSASTAFEFNAVTDPNPFVGILWPIESVKTVTVDLPPGFVGNPTVADQCTTAQLADDSLGDLTAAPLCPPTSQVGVVRVRTGNGPSSVIGPLPLFNMVPPTDAPARFGFNVTGTIVILDAELRSDGDYGVTVVARNTAQAIAVQGTEVTLWGVPSDASHDRDRACPGTRAPSESGPTCTSGAPRVPFLRNPTMCTPDLVGLPTTLRVDTWEHPGDFRTTQFESHLPPGYPLKPQDWGDPQGPDGCDRVPFRPTLAGAPDKGAKAGQPAGFSFDLSLPQTDNPDAVATSDLRKAVVTLPQGVRVNPSAAGGLAGCSSAQIGLDNRAEPTCPDASRIGSLTIETPLLRDPLEGGVYLAAPFDNKFNALIAIYLVARGPGFVVKLPGLVSPDASKGGQMTATFDNQPQVPFTNLHLEFKGGQRAPISLPKRCGTYTTHAQLTGWSGAVVERESSFTIREGCGGGFAPGFEAGTVSSAAGRSSPFLLRMTRGEADQDLKSVAVEMPPGLTGRIADADLCDAGRAAAGTCGDGSRVGSVTVGAGAGTSPFYITNGRAHITGPYNGAPFGLSIVVPAVAGPFDLGTVVVRSAIFVDKHTAELRVVSDPLPTQLQGIQLDVRDVRVTVDRSGFILNPTNCEEMQVAGRIESTEGASANVSSRFQAADCASLPLRPRMSLRVGGRRATQRGRTTPFTATLRQGAGQAALRVVRVTLPTTINARLTVINDACTRAEYEAGNCEPSRTGSATARTPLLRDALSGGVYFVRNGNPLPDLFVRLRGQVDFDLIGKITIPGSKRLRTTFAMVPDVPVSTFTLRLDGGREGSVGNAANLCSRRGRSAKAELSFTGQNGKQLDVRQRLQIRGCRTGRGARGRRGRRR